VASAKDTRRECTDEHKNGAKWYITIPCQSRSTRPRGGLKAESNAVTP
jgi:hypothetical protein